CTPGTNVVIDSKLVTEHCILSTSPVMANNQWIRAEFEVTKDGEVTHFINGTPVFHYSDPQYDPTDPDAKPLIAAAGGLLAVRKGYIYLQSEGHPVEFRHIEVMKLK
ncbi:MAG: family 16 glycoside hydrolase, partial [Sphingomicrobium sp.]